MVESNTTQRVSLQPAYLLHSRPFRDSSMIIDVLTPQFGRLSLMARGVRSGSSSRRAILQPFRSLLISWQGRGELPTLTTVEEAGAALMLEGVHLACGYYLSELVQRLVGSGEMQAEVFALYDRTIRSLAAREAPEQVLRRAEAGLLDALGLLPDLTTDTATGELVDTAGHYSVDVHEGPRYSPESGSTVAGSTLLGLSSGGLSDRRELAEAKHLMRRLIGYYIGDKPLKSRELFHVYAPKGADEA